jgi:hypothetical protein
MGFANNTSHMLLILIPIAWLTVVTVFMAAGRMAARGDVSPPAPPAVREQSLRNTSVDGLTLWEDPVEVGLQDLRRRRPRRLAGHGLTHHGVR